MKLGKAMNKLKFWSRKKKKKKTHVIEHPPSHCCHSWLPPVQPSAPPLPPWFGYEHTGNSLSGSAFGPESGIGSSSQAEFFTPQEIVPDSNSLFPVPNSSYQQYMVPNPVYGVPVLPAVKIEKKAGIFGCVFSIGRHLIRCFCPCFHIREVD